MAKTTTLTCEGCGRPFEKATKEVTRQRKLNPEHKFYCKMKCYAEHEGKKHLDGVRPDASHLNPGNRRDKHSAFRRYYRLIHGRGREADVDLEYLRLLWEKQKGICALSGLRMVLPPTTQAYEQDRNNPWKPSIDRIDSSKGYVKGNIRFVVTMANHCKNKYTDEDVHTFCKAVAENLGR